MLLDYSVAILRRLPPETAHVLTVQLSSRFGMVLPKARPDDPRLAVSAFGLDFSNPIGMAAGFDKNAEAYAVMFRLGFGHVECGTVTPQPQDGSPGLRMFRLRDDQAIINRMSFNNIGMARVAARLARRKAGGVLGINIGANKGSADRIADYRIGYERLAAFADYIAVNISSPNTPGLRKLQDGDALRQLLDTLADARAKANKPVLLKIAPDLAESALDEIATIALEAKLDGLIVSNTTTLREGLHGPHANEEGGLSGRPLFALSTKMLKAMRARVGDKIPLVGVGGVSSGADAYAKIRAGASLVQVYTALVYQGIGLLPRIKRDLLAYMERDGFATIKDAIGADVK